MNRTLSRLRSLRFEPLEPRSLLSAIPVGGEFHVNTYTTYGQGSPSVAIAADGDFVVAWISHYQDGSFFGIYAQRYNAAGVAQGNEFRVNTHTTNEQRDVSIAMDADGDFVVAWRSLGQDGSGEGIYAQRYNAAGMAQGTEFRVNSHTTSNQTAPSVAMDDDGAFVIAWVSSGQDGNGDGVYAQRYNAAGVTQGAEFLVNSHTTSNQNDPAVAMDADGAFVIVWVSSGQDGNNDGVYAQRYNATGVAQGAEFQVNTYTTSYQRSPSVAMDDDGNFVVVWHSYAQDGHNTGTYAQRYNAAGTAQGPEFRVNTYTTDYQRGPSIAADADGDFVVTWYNNDGIYAKRYNVAGLTQGTEFRVNTFTDPFIAIPSVAMDADGDFVVAWTSAAQEVANYSGVYAQRYTAGLFADFDDDGDEDAQDIDFLWRIVRGTASDPGGDDTGDLDQSGTLNENDVDFMVGSRLFHTIYGDADLDFDVDAADFDAWRIRDSLGWATGDFDGDNDVDGADFDLWRLRPTTYPETVTPLAAEQSAFAALALAASSSAEVQESNSRSVEESNCAGDTSTLAPFDTSTLPTPHSPLRTPHSPDPASSPMYRSRHLRRLPSVSPALADKLFAT